MNAPSAPLADQAARRIARERYDVPILLEAGAGTGKTRALVERLLAWLLDAGWREAASRLEERARAALRTPPSNDAVADDLLDGVVAITFTDAAAAEMAERLARALAAIAAGLAPSDGLEIVASVGRETAAERAEILLDRLGRARIQTIHAFCRAILAEHPFEAGLHPAFEVDADERELERLASETVAEQLTLRLEGEGDPDLLDLLGDGVEAESILAAVLEATRAGRTPAALEADPFPPDRVEAELARARLSIQDLVEALGAVEAKLNTGQRGFYEALGALCDGLGAGGDRIERLEWAAGAAGEIRERFADYLKKWPRGESLATLVKHRGDAGEPLPALAARARAAIDGLDGVSPIRLARRRRLIAPLLRAVRERLRREGSLLFGDLLERAAELVERRPEIRDALRRGIRQLLIDEFQDTDDRQCRLIERLALDPGGAARPGLFVVGDPKQSIYAWRGADLAAYERFVERALEVGGLRARLEVNFRSVPAILEEVTRIVGPEMVAEPGLQPPFEPLRASAAGVERGERASRPAVEVWTSTGPSGPRTRSGEANRLEARAVARDIRHQRELDPTASWRDFGILARSTTEIEALLQALREAGVPFAVERDRSYWRRREVIDLAATVRAILEPGDHLALVTFLRSPFVGVPDAALIPLWQRRLPGLIDELSGADEERLGAIAAHFDEVARTLGGTVPGLERIAGWPASARLALEALAELREAFGRLPAEDWVERLRARLAPEATAAGRFLGRFGVANLSRFLRELTEALEAGGDDPATVLRSLRGAVAERREAEEAQPPESDGDAVRVLTIHRAKGLEFRQVYVVQLHRGRGRGREKAYVTAAPDPAGLPVYRLLSCRTFGSAAAEALGETIATRERVRLLYVAMTRARDRLVLAGQLFAERSAESFLPMISRRRNGTAAEAGPPAEPTIDQYGTRWRTPALEPASAAGPRAPDVPQFGPVDPAAVVAEQERLCERRIAAGLRAARVRVARASDAAAERDGDSAPQLVGMSSGPARRRGVVLHRALELAPEAALDPIAWRRAALLAAAGPIAEDERDALELAVDRLRSTALWHRIGELEPHVLARELPLLVAAGADQDAELPTPIDGHVGALDLLYRDPRSSQLVVADFKSDALDAESEIAARIATYGPQLARYGRAVQESLGLERPPRLELWFLALDRM